MTEEHKIILKAIEEALNRDPELRFGQALFNLGINQFVNPEHPAESNYRVRDIHGDDDIAIIDRIRKQQEWRNLQLKVTTALEKPELKGISQMTVNERLYASDLINEFDSYKTQIKHLPNLFLRD
jgi:hypothetical protein